MKAGISKSSLFYELLVLLTVLTFTLFAFGCGGSDGGSSSGDSNEPTDNTTTSIAGAGVKGPLAGAVVRLYQVDLTISDLKGELLDEGSTGSDAAIDDLEIEEGLSGLVLLEFVVDDDTVEVNTGEAPVFDKLVTVCDVRRIYDGDAVYASPLTTMAVSLARRKADTGAPYAGNGDDVISESEFVAALAVAQDQVKSTLGFGLDSTVDIFTVPPLITSETDTTEEQTAVAAYRQAIEALAAIADQVADDSVADDSAQDIVDALVDDLSDGEIDGENEDGPIEALTDLNEDIATTLTTVDLATLLIPGTDRPVSDVESELVDEMAATGEEADTEELENDTIEVDPEQPEVSVDRDGDGVNNINDAFPDDATEWLDTDDDTIGNNADTDDDDDGVVDADDAFPLNAAEWLDTDGDKIGNNADTDDDNDGVVDTNDAFPLDAAEWLDTDGDLIGNNADTDDDNDGILDDDDAYPLDPTCHCANWELPEPEEKAFRIDAPDTAEVNDQLTLSMVPTGDASVDDYSFSWFVDAEPDPEPGLTGASVQYSYSLPSRYRIQVQVTNLTNPEDVFMLVDYINVARPYSDTVYALTGDFGPQDVKAYGDPDSGAWCNHYYDVYYGKYTEFWRQQGTAGTNSQIVQLLALGDFFFEYYTDFFGWDYRGYAGQRYTQCNDVVGGGCGAQGLFLNDYYTSNEHMTDEEPIIHEMLAAMAHEYIHTWDFRANSFFGPDSAHALTSALERTVLADLDWSFLGDYDGETVWVTPWFMERCRNNYVLKRYMENPDLSWETYFSDELMSLSSEERWDTVDFPERQESMYVQGGFLSAIRDMHGHEALKAFFRQIDLILAADPDWNQGGEEAGGPEVPARESLANMVTALADALQLDVAPYFDYWKVPLTDELRAYTAQYPESTMLDDADGDGYSPLEGDLDDCDATIYPDAPELVDGKDNNQEGQVDEYVYDEAVLGDFGIESIELPALIRGEISDQDDVDEFRLILPEGKRILVAIHPLEAPNPAPLEPDGDQIVSVYSGNVQVGYRDYDSIAEWTSGETTLVTYLPEAYDMGAMAITLDALDRDWANGVPGKYELQLVPEDYEAAPYNESVVMSLISELYPTH